MSGVTFLTDMDYLCNLPSNIKLINYPTIHDISLNKFAILLYSQPYHFQTPELSHLGDLFKVSWKVPGGIFQISDGKYISLHIAAYLSYFKINM